MRILTILSFLILSTHAVAQEVPAWINLAYDEERIQGDCEENFEEQYRTIIQRHFGNMYTTQALEEKQVRCWYATDKKDHLGIQPTVYRQGRNVIKRTFDVMLNDQKIGNYDPQIINVLYGFGKKDFISGGDGIDIIIGGSGSDGLTGGFGNDLLVGGSQSDFYFTREVDKTRKAKDILYVDNLDNAEIDIGLDVVVKPKFQHQYTSQNILNK